jgi:phosphoribosylanthranilate isomerase
MEKLKVKICGITNLEDALLCSDANALGFIFAKSSPRFISPETCKQICSSLNPLIQRVGVFVNEEIPNLLKTVSHAGLGAIQLHGKEDNEYISKLKKLTALPIIKACRVSSAEELEETIILAKILKETVQAFLLDTPFAKAHEDKTFIHKELYEQFCKKTQHPVILAGGLTPENIPRIIKSHNPQCIDLCSGLERQAGKKDSAKVKRFWQTLA